MTSTQIAGQFGGETTTQESNSVRMNNSIEQVKQSVDDLQELFSSLEGAPIPVNPNCPDAPKGVPSIKMLMEDGPDELFTQADRIRNLKNSIRNLFL